MILQIYNLLLQIAKTTMFIPMFKMSFQSWIPDSNPSEDMCQTSAFIDSHSKDNAVFLILIKLPMYTI